MLVVMSFLPSVGDGVKANEFATNSFSILENDVSPVAFLRPAVIMPIHELIENTRHH